MIFGDDDIAFAGLRFFIGMDRRNIILDQLSSCLVVIDIIWILHRISLNIVYFILVFAFLLLGSFLWWSHKRDGFLLHL